MLTAIYLSLVLMPFITPPSEPVNKASEAALIASGLKEEMNRAQRWATRKLDDEIERLGVKPAAAAVGWVAHAIIEKRAVVSMDIRPICHAATISVSPDGIAMEMVWSM